MLATRIESAVEARSKSCTRSHHCTGGLSGLLVQQEHLQHHGGGREHPSDGATEDSDTGDTVHVAHEQDDDDVQGVANRDKNDRNAPAVVTNMVSLFRLMSPQHFGHYIQHFRPEEEAGRQNLLDILMEVLLMFKVRLYLISPSNTLLCLCSVL